MLEVIEKAFPELLNSEKGKQLINKMVPMWNVTLNKGLFNRELEKSKDCLKL